MGLYQKYRPATLPDMVGNDAVVAGLQAHFAQAPDRISHAHIIHGDSGCGKTTLARAVAHSILGATEMTIREINTADNRGIDTVREIIEQMRMLPLGGKSVVYLIDEAHGLSTDAKRALLKPLEDTPKHVYFFLCTTNLPSLLKGDEGKAIGTRATQWKVEPLTTRHLFRLVSRTAKAEGMEPDDELFTAIAEAAGGSPRSALVTLEKVMSAATREAQMEPVHSGLADSDPELIELCRALMGGKPRDVMDLLGKFKQQDAEKVRRTITGYMSSVLLKRLDAKAAVILEEFCVPTYDNGFNTLVLSATRALLAIQGDSRN